MSIKIINGESWQKAAGFYTPAKFSMTIVHPRPDTDSPASWARHKNAYPGIQYRCPVTVQGGAWPFKYELLQSPTGMTIGETYGSTASPNTDYGVITWTPTGTSGPHNVEVKVTDQDGNTVTTLFTITSNTTNFAFFDINDTTSLATGTITEPYNSFSDWYDFNNLVTIGNKILYWRAGTYSHPSTALRFGNNDPLVHLGYPGESAVIQGTNGNFNFLGTSTVTDDMFVGGLKFSGGYFSTGVNNRMLVMRAGTGRWTIFENTFADYSQSGATNDNPCAIFAGAVSRRNYQAIVGNRFTNFSMGRTSGVVAGWILYQCNYLVCENNTNDNISAASSGLLKGEILNYTQRNNRCSQTQTDLGRGWEILGDETSGTFGSGESCHNIHYGILGTRHLYDSAAGDYTGRPMYTYRDTFYEGNMLHIATTVTGDEYRVERVVCEGTINAGYDTDPTGDEANYANVAQSNFLSDSRLTDAYLTTISRTRGEVGHEVI